jgi:quercetin 2,3-dioxygenase
MITLAHATDRGLTDLGWLDSRHTFSFGGYYDPRAMGFGPLRVINDDRVIGGGGFGTHSHRDMEIISVVLEGGLAHRDSMGNGDVIRPGDVQVMSAGTGVAHSEFNASATEPVHFLQIWIVPERNGSSPRYEQRNFDAEGRDGRLQLVVSGDGADDSLRIGRDARVYRARLGDAQSVTHELRPGRRAWVQIASGEATVSGIDVSAGDGVALEHETSVTVQGRGRQQAEVLLFDLD